MSGTSWRLACAAIALFAIGCGSGDECGHMTISGPFTVVADPPVVSVPSTVIVSSPNLQDRVSIPERFTCAGIGASPGLSWDNLPANTRQIAFVVTDPDAPGGTFFHWMVYGIAADVAGNPACHVPAGARQGMNGAGQNHYYPPCPPSGSPAHEYHFTVYALDAPIELAAGASPEQVLDAIQRRALAQGVLIAPFSLP
jgi:Raf kinase inhibitor-like YbhB/YbcL family protein